jgi:hypothetical protein
MDEDPTSRAGTLELLIPVGALSRQSIADGK